MDFDVEWADLVKKAGSLIALGSPLPFAEAEEMFRLVLANLCGEEHWSYRVGGVLQIERANGDGFGVVD